MFIRDILKTAEGRSLPIHVKRISIHLKGEPLAAVFSVVHGKMHLGLPAAEFKRDQSWLSKNQWLGRQLHIMPSPLVKALSILIRSTHLPKLTTVIPSETHNSHSIKSMTTFSSPFNIYKQPLPQETNQSSIDYDIRSTTVQAQHGAR